MTLQEFFDFYDVSGRQRTRWSRFLEPYDWADVTTGLDHVRRTATTTAVPTLTAVRAAIHEARRGRLDRERSEAAKSRGLDARQNSAAELRLFGLIRALNLRGVLWHFAAGCWVGPDEPQYHAVVRQNLGSRHAMTGTEPTLGGALAAWERYAPGEPEPRPLRMGDPASFDTRDRRVA